MTGQTGQNPTPKPKPITIIPSASGPKVVKR